ATAHAKSVSTAIDLPGMQFRIHAIPDKYLLLVARRASLAPTLAPRYYKTFYGARQIGHRGDNDVGARHLKLLSKFTGCMTCPRQTRSYSCLPKQWPEYPALNPQ